MDWLIWQLADSALPTGGFAHSLGLESAWQQGEVDAASLPTFIRHAMSHVGRGALPFVTAAHRAPDDLATVDARCDAFLVSVVANRASRTQGRAWLATIERAFPRPAVRVLCSQARSTSLPRHYAPMFGATLRTLNVDASATERLFLYTSCRSLLSAAVRLGLIGTTEAQRLLADCGENLDRTLERCSTVEMNDVAQTAPLVDLWQSAHDRLYSRLFQS